MKKTMLGCLAILMLTGCSPALKTAEYTFNQGIPACQGQPSALRGATDNPTRTGAGSTNSGGSGNTIIIIESTAQDSQANPDLSGVADAVADQLTGGLTDVLDVDLNGADLTESGNIVEVE